MRDILSFDQYSKHYDNNVNENRRSYHRLLQHQKNDPFIVIMSVERKPVELGRKILDILDNKETSFSKARLAGIRQNNTNTKQFRRVLSELKCGYFPVIGQYTETDKLTGSKAVVEEHGQVIYCSEQNKDDVLDTCLDWANKTDQECILIAHKGRGYLYFPQTNKHENLGDFHLEKLGDNFTILHRHKNKDNSTSNIKYFEFSNEKIANKIRQFMNDE